MKTFLYKLGLLSILTVNLFTHYHIIQAEDKPLIEMDEDTAKLLDELNFSDAEKAEFENMIETINNLPPEQKKGFTDLVESMDEAVNKGEIDPNNLDSLLEWMMKAEEETEKKEEKKPKKAEIPSVKQPETPIIKTIAPASNAYSMLEEISKHLLSLRQKALYYDLINTRFERFKPELDQLIYFLHILKNPDLIKHLTSIDFANLYKNLEALHKVLIEQEPAITIFEPEVLENPYNILGLQNYATNEQIEKAFTNLRNLYSPEALTKKLQAEGLQGRELEKRIKKAKVSFSFIEEAYEQLKDPKQKALIDRAIKEELENQKRIEQSALASFETISHILTSNLFAILSDIKKLLEKYKPEELEKAKKQEEIEKRILSETKRPVRIIKGDAGYRTKVLDKGDYEEFHKHLAQRDRARTKPYFGSGKLGFDNDFGIEEPRTGGFRPSDKKEKPPTDKEKKDEKKEDKKDDKKKDEKKEDKKDTKGKTLAKAEKGGIVDKDVQQAATIDNLAKLLDETKDEIEVEAPKMPTRKIKIDEGEAEEEEKKKGEKVKLKIKHISKGLNDYLITAPTLPTRAGKSTLDTTGLDLFAEFAKANKLKDIWTTLKELDPSKSKIENQVVIKKWKDKIDKHKKKIEAWYEKFYVPLNPTLRKEKNLQGINPDKLQLHGLHVKEETIKDPNKDVKIPQAIKDKYAYDEPENLAAARKYIKDIYTIFNSISSSTKASDNKKTS